MTNQSPLHSIRILDFSWVLAGPYATRILADFGAEVIKVQPVTSQEENRFDRGYKKKRSVGSGFGNSVLTRA